MGGQSRKVLKKVHLDGVVTDSERCLRWNVIMIYRFSRTELASAQMAEW